MERGEEEINGLWISVLAINIQAGKPEELHDGANYWRCEKVVSHAE